MRKVLVVDDDKLARKGLVSAVPWQKYDLEVVGEAKNGEDALQFIKHKPVDLLITDLAMPVMTGIELMRNVREQFPHIWIVVLTFHQDFELVQDALRLGAIDYISKIQLEMEQLDDVVGRIMERIRQEEQQRPRQLPLLRIHLSDLISVKDELWVMIALQESLDANWIETASAHHSGLLFELEWGVWLILNKNKNNHIRDEVAVMKELSQIASEELYIMVRVDSCSDMTIDTFRRQLHDYKQYTLVYEYRREKKLYYAPGDSLRLPPPTIDETQLMHIIKKWSSLTWVISEDLYRELLQELEQVRLPMHKLQNIFVFAIKEWLSVVSVDSSLQTAAQFTNQYWHEWLTWIDEVRLFMRNKLHKSAYSEEITLCILDAMKYINEHLSTEIRVKELARQVNMSLSYFSQCFKDIVGLSFSDYLKKVRIAHAQQLLLKTTNPIYWVAEQCGYPDEKYFSRVFREIVGTIPSKFRSRNIKGENNLK